MRILLLLTLLLSACSAQGPVVNRAPQFLPNGDMARFSIPEDTRPGSPVYKLQGSDPEGSRVLYSISGEFFTVDRNSGVVTLIKKLDREQQDFITVVISITDEGIGGSEPNTISLLREIPVLDINDNAPTFHHRPYSIRLFESTAPGKQLFDNITVEDKDGGINGDVILSCIPPSEPVCRTFDITTEKESEGHYKGIITLRMPLDYELQRSYSLTVKATDRAKDPTKRLTATANVVIEVEDVQDQPPVFLNAPYSATTPENTEEGKKVLRLGARDGDVGDPRVVRLDILDDFLGYFSLVPTLDEPTSDFGAPVTWRDLITTDNPLDREHPDILESGGIYSFRVRATELINGELPADFTDTTVTIVVTDMDDQLPVFNQPQFHINVSEQISLGSPLPGLSMMVADGDIGDNAKYFLSLRDVANSRGAIALHPRMGQGHTVIVLRVNNTQMMDFDVDDEDLKQIIFDVVASIKNEYDVVREVASSRVFIHLQDANDNAPEFNNNSFYLSVREDVPPNSLIAPVTATDRDSGLFGKLSYHLTGFGTKKFRTDAKTGGVYVGPASLDYESEKSYTLTLVAVDGGNRSTSVSVYIDVEDVNDNKPTFELKEFSRTIRTKSKSFQPEFFIHAEDKDGVKQGGGQIKYEITEKNYEGNTIDINEETGEIFINGEVSPEHTPKGQYEFTVRAWDFGEPKLHGETRVNVKVGYIGNERPFFRGNEKTSNGISFYNFTVKENIKPRTKIYQLEAVDPDGAAGQLTYFLTNNGKDNFEVDGKTGILRTSSYVDLDLERNPPLYRLKVEVVDTGFPVSETGTVEVLVNIEDVNNKSPMFDQDAYTFYVSEDTDVGTTIASVQANDTDENPDIVYSILEPVQFFDKSGLTLNHRNVFNVTNDGEIILLEPLSQTVNNVVIKVEAEDRNAEEERQNVTTDILLYVQSGSDMNPVFIDSSWTPKHPVIHVKIDEELPKHSVVYSIKVRDPFESEGLLELQEIRNDYPDTFSVGVNGDVTLLRRLDYENSPVKIFNISVRVVVAEDFFFEINLKSSKESILNLEELPQVRFADAILEIELNNINDFAPIFQQNMYRKRVLESIKHPEVLLEVRAVDFDNDTVIYSLSGDSASYFTINSSSGEITVRKNASLDREQRNIYKFTVTATDVHEGKGATHKSHAEVWIEVLDVNDNPPEFAKTLYSTVIPENVPIGTNITSVHATDADLGLSGEIIYKIIEESDAVGLFSIDPDTGDITTRRVLTGRGRSDPYNIIVKASDKGDLVLDANGQRNQQSFSSEVTLSVYIGDVVRNDGVPVFIRPELNQRAQVSENASLNTPVFQVIATDPDDPNSAEGQIKFKFLQDGKQNIPFKINSETGLITTKSSLDREKKSSYQVIIVAYDLGDVPQEATRLLQIDVLDVDDHSPLFKRAVNDPPQQMRVLEESPLGSEVGLVECFDEDIGDNALIDYILSDGNSEGLFTIDRSEENIGVIKLSGRVDRETASGHLLTVKCFKKSSDGKKLNYLRPYNAKDLSEAQFQIFFDDIDDNGPIFPHSNLTLGVRLNVPPDTNLVTLSAVDPDADSAPLEYHIDSVSFKLLGKSKQKPIVPAENLFTIGEKTGELRTLGSMQKYSDGYFQVNAFANNTEDISRRGNVTAKIFVLRDKSLLKFVFNKSPQKINRILPDIEKAVAAALQMSSVNIYDTQFLTKRDGSLDFSSASSCFQVIGNRSYSLDELERLLNSTKNAVLRKVFADYEITGVERCAALGARKDASWVQIWVLVLAAAIGVLSLIAAVSICCCYARYKRLTKPKKQVPVPVPPSTIDYMTIRTPASASVMRTPASFMGSQLVLNKPDRSVKGSQLTLNKAGTSVLMNQPATQMGSQLIINPSTNKPIIMGSQMLAPRSAAHRSAGLSEAREDFGSQVMYEYVNDGNDNMGFEDS